MTTLEGAEGAGDVILAGMGMGRAMGDDIGVCDRDFGARGMATDSLDATVARSERGIDMSKVFYFT